MNYKKGSILPLSRRKLAVELKKDIELNEANQGSEIINYNDKMQQLLKTCRIKRDKSDGLAESVAKSRQIFLLNYSIEVKRKEMRRLDEALKSELKKIEKMEQDLKDQSEKFDNALLESDKMATEASKVLEVETNKRLEKSAILKKLKTETYSLSAELIKTDERLKFLKSCEEFVEKLTKEMIVLLLGNENTTNDVSKSEEKINENLKSDIATRTTEEFVKDPNNVKKIFDFIESTNLKLILRNQDVNERLEDMAIQKALESFKLDQEIELLEDSINSILKSIEKEKKLSKDLETKAKLFSYGEFNQQDQEKLLQKIENEIYKTSEKISDKSHQNQLVLKSNVEKNSSNNSSSKKGSTKQLLFTTNKAKTPLAILESLEKKTNEILELKVAIINECPENFENIKRMKEREWKSRMREEQLAQNRKEQEARAERNKKKFEVSELNKNKIGPKERQKLWDEMKKGMKQTKDSNRIKNSSSLNEQIGGPKIIFSGKREDLTSLNYYMKF